MRSIPPDAVVRRRDDLLANELSDSEAVMLDMDRGRYFGVQSVAKVIWDELGSPTTLGQLCQDLIRQYEVDPATCRREVGAFLDELLEHGLIEIHDADQAT